MDSFGNILKIVENQYFCVFDIILTLEEGCYQSEICDWRYSNIPGTIWKNFSSKTGEIFSARFSLKYGTLNRSKATFLKLGKQGLS